MGISQEQNREPCGHLLSPRPEVFPCGLQCALAYRCPLLYPPTTPGTGPASCTPVGSTLSGNPWSPPLTTITHTQTSGSKAFLKQPGGLGSSFSSPFYTTQHSPAVGTEPQTRILVTICFPENRILVHFTSWSFKLKAGRGTAWPTWRSVENRNPLGVTSVFLPKTGLWDNSGILQSICTFQVRVPFS